MTGVQLTTEINSITGEIISACFEVSNTLGAGFLENVYSRALAHELCMRNVPYTREVSVDVEYKEVCVGRYVADLIVCDQVVVELKAISNLSSTHVGQVLNYLRATNLKWGLLINFGTPKIQIRRVVI